MYSACANRSLFVFYVCISACASGSLFVFYVGIKAGVQICVYVPGWWKCVICLSTWNANQRL